MKRNLALASLAFLGAGAFFSKWFLIPGGICIVGLLVWWHDENKAKAHLHPAVEALYATGVPALFTCTGWGPLVMTAVSDPTLKHFRQLAFNPVVIFLAGFYALSFWVFSKGEKGGSGVRYETPDRSSVD